MSHRTVKAVTGRLHRREVSRPNNFFFEQIKRVDSLEPTLFYASLTRRLVLVGATLVDVLPGIETHEHFFPALLAPVDLGIRIRVERIL
jgi:hypothetical protein